MGEVVLKADSLYSFLEKRRGSKLGQLLTWVVFPLRSPSWLTSPPSPVTPQLCPSPVQKRVPYMVIVHLGIFGQIIVRDFVWFKNWTVIEQKTNTLN